ncbi:MAG: hypothetical protein II932_00560 [Treponema sp.]|nr:hypothetical protein [Treponema sp.]
MKHLSRMLALALCLTAAMDAGFAAGTRKTSAKEGIMMAEAESALFSDGYKVTAVTLLYRKKIEPSSVSADDFEIAGQTVKSVSVEGRKVKLSLNCDNRWYPERRDAPEQDADSSFSRYVTVTQSGDVTVSGGKEIYAGPATVTSKKIIDPKVIREFNEKVFKDDETGMELRYCVYLPLYYTEGWNYPVIVFIPDSRANTNVSKSTLLQGEGATVWATEAEQEKMRSIIIAVQYPKYVQDQYGPLVKEDGSWTVGLQTVYDLIRSELANTRADRNRIYGIGQGDGAAANLQIGQKYPSFYAAQLAISPIYDIKDTQALERGRLWLMVSSNDRQSREAAERAATSWKNDGVRVNSAIWKVDLSEKEFEKAAKEQADKKGTVKYTMIDGGCREYTWCIAHRINAIREWLSAQ